MYERYKTVFDGYRALMMKSKNFTKHYFALKTTDIQAYADKYEELSISAALRSEKDCLPAHRNLVYTTTDTGKKDYLKQAADVQESKSLFQIVFFPLPCQGYCPNVNCEPTPLFYMSH